MRVGIISIQQECNTFNPAPTTLEEFRQETLLLGEAVRRREVGGHHEVAGFFEALAAENIEAVPLLMAVALPTGIVTDEALQALIRLMFEQLAGAGPLDGFLVGPHGAAVSEKHADMDGYWLSALRHRVGPGVPIVATIDPHANLSAKMVSACDAILAYRTNPHVDQKLCGAEAARLLARTLRKEIRPVMAAAFPRVAINIERQRTAHEPCASLYASADDMLKQPGVLSNSVVLGFPYADVEEMGSAFIVVADGNLELARQHADTLAKMLVRRRQDFVGQLISVEEALDLALKSPKPVCLLDMGDNVGGGSPADGTLLAHALHARKVHAYVCLFDPQAVAAAEAAGVGKTVTLPMGGKTDPQHGEPLELPVTVRGLYEGKFSEPQIRHGARSTYDMGRTAVVTTSSGLTLALTSRRILPVSLGQFACCGLDPKSFDVLVAKGVQAPVAAYAEVCPTLIRVNTPGMTSADMRHFTYQHRRKPLFPFEEIA